MKIYFFCGVIVLKLIEGKDNYQIDKIYFPDKLGVNAKTLFQMVDYYAKQKNMISNLSNYEVSYFIDSFKNEEELIRILIDNGYSKSHCIDIVRKCYKKLAQLKKYGI